LSQEPAKYEFKYDVKDDASGNDFGHQESRDGDYVQGEYRVLLPDGRMQIVKYEADQNGYRPTIEYEGEANNNGANGGNGGNGQYASNGGYSSGGPSGGQGGFGGQQGGFGGQQGGFGGQQGGRGNNGGASSRAPGFGNGPY